jgi:hypothetical protein
VWILQQQHQPHRRNAGWTIHHNDQRLRWNFGIAQHYSDTVCKLKTRASVVGFKVGFQGWFQAFAPERRLFLCLLFLPTNFLTYNLVQTL